MGDGRLAAEGTVVLLVVLHDDQAPDTKGMATTQLDGSPFELHVTQNLRVDFSAHSFGKVLGELWVFDLAWKGPLHSESCPLIEFYVRVSVLCQ
jgi:hypothetical protein